jgi:hypothetical protein
MRCVFRPLSKELCGHRPGRPDGGIGFHGALRRRGRRRHQEPGLRPGRFTDSCHPVRHFRIFRRYALIYRIADKSAKNGFCLQTDFWSGFSRPDPSRRRERLSEPPRSPHGTAEVSVAAPTAVTVASCPQIAQRSMTVADAWQNDHQPPTVTLLTGILNGYNAAKRGLQR